MYERKDSYVFNDSFSNLYENLDVIRCFDDSNGDARKMSLLSVHKTKVNILHCLRDGRTDFVKIGANGGDKGSSTSKSIILQAKWCTLATQEVVVIATFEGLMIYDAEGSILLFFHSLTKNDPDNTYNPEDNNFCRGIICIKEKYICVGTSNGSVLVITAKGNQFQISETIRKHSDAVAALGGCREPASDEVQNALDIDFVCSDDSGNISTFKSSSSPKFEFCSFMNGDGVPCTCLQLAANGLIFAGYLNGRLRVFDSGSSTLLADIAAHARIISCLDVSPKVDPESGRLVVASGSEDSFVRVWHVTRDDVIQVSHEWAGSILNLAVCGLKFSDDYGRSVLVSGYDTKEVIQFVAA